MLDYKTQSYMGGTYAPNDAQAMNAYLQAASDRENLGYHVSNRVLPILDYIKTKMVELNRPIIIYLSPTSSMGAHVVVAYGYKETWDYIDTTNGPIEVCNTSYRVHSGWHTDVEENQMKDDIYIQTIIGSVAWLESYDPHNHSYISCTDSNDEIHDLKCFNCNLIKRSQHNYTYRSTGDINHVKECTDCDHTRIEDHNYRINSHDTLFETLSCTKCDQLSFRSHKYGPPSTLYLRTKFSCRMVTKHCTTCTYVDYQIYNSHTFIGDTCMYCNYKKGSLW